MAAAAIISSITLTAYAHHNGQKNGNGLMRPETCGLPRGWGHFGFGRGYYGFVEVSEEFEESVINIAKGDPDVQELLADGYNITGVMPIIKARVEANGDVVIKATSAIVMLRKDTTGSASVWVDVEEARVTRIVILTRTVIEKP